MRDIRHQLLSYVDRLENMTDPEAVVPALVDSFQIFGSDRHVITGVPMPHQEIGAEVISIHWPDHRTGRAHRLSATDIVVQKAIDWPFSFILRERFHQQSDLARAAGLEANGQDLLVIPVVGVSKFHGLVALTFCRPSSHSSMPSEQALPTGLMSLAVCIVHTAFRRLAALDALKVDRKGQLTPREREILALSAFGKSAKEIGSEIGISELTVIAHIRNASMKLMASNRSECILQAIRFNQIGPGAGRGFYEMDTEIFAQADYDYREIFQ